MTEQRVTGFDFEALRHADEQHDLDAMLDLYADDAEIHILNRNTSPSSPYVLRGKEAISEYLRDVFGRDMTHRVESEVVGEDRVAFNVACEYPEGSVCSPRRTSTCETARSYVRWRSWPGTNRTTGDRRGPESLSDVNDDVGTPLD
jgi:hypothetical protein